MLKVDLHLHTADDPVDRIPHDARALVDRAAALGFQALAITLHDRQLTDGRLTAYARERDIVLLPGIERTVEGKHVLLINFPHTAEHVRTFGELSVLKQRSDGVVIAPHPFFPAPSCLRSALDKWRDLFDAVEWSYFWTRGVDFNARAAQWARAHGKALVGNSDLHDLRQLGRTCSWVRADRRPDAICHAIREGRVSLQTAPVPGPELLSILSAMALRGRKRWAFSPADFLRPART